MHLEGAFGVEADRKAVFEFLTDPRRVSRHIPDVRDVEVHDADHFTIKAMVGISHIKGPMAMKLTITERRPPVSTTMTGKGSGLASVVDMVTSFTLETSDGGTIVKWRGDVNVAGKLAAFSPQGLLDRMARQNVEKFIEGIRMGVQGSL
jgi:carbon monoxide dehydrogenase subunit G